MAENSNASCLTATTTIVVAVIGAATTITAALIALWPTMFPPTQRGGGNNNTIILHNTPTPVPPTPDGRGGFEETPTPTPAPPPGSRLEGVYTLQDQDIGQPFQGTMTVTKASDGVFRWQTGYTYLAYPDIPLWAKGELIDDEGEWAISMHSTNEPGSVPYAGIPVRVTFGNKMLTITLDDGRAMTWRKR